MSLPRTGVLPTTYLGAKVISINLLEALDLGSSSSFDHPTAVGQTAPGT